MEFATCSEKEVVVEGELKTLNVNSIARYIVMYGIQIIPKITKPMVSLNTLFSSYKNNGSLKPV